MVYNVNEVILLFGYRAGNVDTMHKTISSCQG